MPMQTTDQWGTLLPKGLGTDQEATQATSAMRQSPWYQDWAKKNGVQFSGDQYGNARLNDSQQQDLYNLALKNGIGLNNKYDQIDENGQISEAHHKLRNALIAAAIGGASLTGLGAAGIGPLSGMFGAGASAAGAGAGVADLGAVNGAMIGGASGIPGMALGEAAPFIGSGAFPPAFGLNAVDSLWSPAAASAAGAGAGGAAGTTMANLMTPKNFLASGMTSNAKGIPSQFGMNAVDTETSGPSDLIKNILSQNHPEMIQNGIIDHLTPEELQNVMAKDGNGPGSKIWDLITRADNNPFANLSSSIAGFGQGLANNRALKGAFTQNYDRNMLEAQSGATAARNAAMQNVQQASYLKGLDKGYSAPDISLASGNHVQLPDFGYGYKAATPEEKQAAELLQTQALKTLGPGGTYTPQPLESYANPGAGETAANAGATISGMVPTVAPFLKQVPWGQAGNFIKNLFT